MTIAYVSFRKKEFLELAYVLSVRAIACHRDEKSSSRSARIRVYEQRSHFRDHVSEHTRNVNANRKGLARTVQFPCDVSISIAVNPIAAPSFRGPFNPLCPAVWDQSFATAHWRAIFAIEKRFGCGLRANVVTDASQAAFDAGAVTVLTLY